MHSAESSGSERLTRITFKTFFTKYDAKEIKLKKWFSDINFSLFKKKTCNHANVIISRKKKKEIFRCEKDWSKLFFYSQRGRLYGFSHSMCDICDFFS